MQKYTADYLNSLPALKQAEGVGAFVNRVAGKILDAATKGNTSFVYQEKQYKDYLNYGMGPMPLRQPTLEELAIAFRDQFPDCKIEVQDNWVDVRPGVREHRPQILIDWTPQKVEDTTSRSRRNSAVMKL